MAQSNDVENNVTHHQSIWSIFIIFLRLGLTSFGGPVAHLAYFRDEFVIRRKWLNERRFSDLIALCQFLPGPASSQAGIALGLFARGYRGAIVAWLGFTLPSAIALILFAIGMIRYQTYFSVDAIHGLKIVAVAVVAQAVWGMARSLCPDVARITLMAASTCIVLMLPSVWTSVLVIIGSGVVGLGICNSQPGPLQEPFTKRISRRVGFMWLSLFFALLLTLPILARVLQNDVLTLFDTFYRTGSLVFGGGHVVLPLLQADVVSPGWVSEEVFLAGYGATQAVPGPLFTFSAFLGASLNIGPGGWTGGLICLVAIFAPSFLLVIGALPFWDSLRNNTRAQASLAGINAGVVGILLAALYDPVWTTAIKAPEDFALALVALIALMFWRLPPWLVVIGCGVAGAVLKFVSV